LKVCFHHLEMEDRPERIPSLIRKRRRTSKDCDETFAKQTIFDDNAGKLPSLLWMLSEHDLTLDTDAQHLEITSSRPPSSFELGRESRKARLKAPVTYSRGSSSPGGVSICDSEAITVCYGMASTTTTPYDARVDSL
jgi:hypothetical protein